MFDRIAAKYQDLKDREDGFTLIELLVVVVIIGILIAIAIPLYLNYQRGSKDKSAQSDLRGAVSALQQCYTENNNGYPTGTATNTAGTSATFTCGTITETANLSDGTTFTYSPKNSDGTVCSAAPCVSFIATTTNSGGNSKTYTYNSTTGGKIN